MSNPTSPSAFDGIGASARSPFARSAFAVRLVVFGVAYILAAELGHFLSARGQDEEFATFWPPSGLLVGTLLLNKRLRWPIVLLVAAAANLASDLVHGKSALLSMGFFVAYGIEACVGAWLVSRSIGRRPNLNRLNDVVALTLLAAVFSTMIGAALGVALVFPALDGASSLGQTWRIWWLADAVGVLVVAPVLLGWVDGESGRQALRPLQVIEVAVLLAGLIVATEGVYGDWVPGSLMAPVVILPFLLWAALRFGPRIASVGLLIVAIVGVGHTSQGRGPYTIRTLAPRQQILRAQGALGVLGVSVLLLAAAAAERKHSDRQRLRLIAQLEHALAEIKTLRGMLPMCAWCKRIRDDSGFWQQIESYLRTHSEAEVSHGICPDCLARELARLDETTK